MFILGKPFVVVYYFNQDNCNLWASAVQICKVTKLFTMAKLYEHNLGKGCSLFQDPETVNISYMNSNETLWQ